jgi:hypothetical protein
MSPVVRLVVTGAAMVGFFLPFFIFTLRKSEKRRSPRVRRVACFS